MDDLENLRKQIDTLDTELLHILSKRVAVVEAVGEYKSRHHMQPLGVKRKQEVINRWRAMAQELGLPEKYVLKFYELIHDYALELEQQVDDRNKKL